jgi:hypothetical protein
MTEPLFLPEYVRISSLMAYAGMVSILAAFLLETRGRLNSRGAVYLWLMIAGSGLLAIRAAHMREWAFLILEAIWCVAAIWAVWRPSRLDADG